MKAYIPNYNLKNAKDIKDALKHLEKGWKIVCGGTDSMVVLEQGYLNEGDYISIWDLPEISKIKFTKDNLEIGAGVTFRNIAENKNIQKEFPMLANAASSVGAIAIQNRATIGGNIVNASPAADSPPTLLAYDASIEITSKSEVRTVALCDFFKGYKQMDLEENEIVTKIIIPREQPRKKTFYRKVGTRKAMAISKVVLSANAKVTKGEIKDIRLALASVAPTTVRVRKIEEFLIGKSVDNKLITEAEAMLGNEIAPISDIRSNDKYRMQVAKNLLRAFLETL
jgi:CO/xanthine dehydrogenase FAD-binding subunit